MKKLFRRWGFHDGKYKEAKPKWHRIAARREYRVPKPMTNGTSYDEPHVMVTALCGYEFDYIPAIHGEKGPLEWKDEIKTARLRCKKCDDAAAKDPEIEMVE